MKTKDLPVSVTGFAKKWADDFLTANPKWKRDKEMCVDEWDTHDGYDLNLYCEDGHFSVCAYPLTTDDRGDTVADMDNMITIVQKGKK
jgi:hypothetical protein